MGEEIPITEQQEHLIAALLTKPTIAAAARAIGINESTARRWLKESAMKTAWLEARRQSMDHAIFALQQASTSAVTTLIKMLKSDQDAVKLRAAQIILEMGIKGIELADMEQRIEALEAAILQKENSHEFIPHSSPAP